MTYGIPLSINGSGQVNFSLPCDEILLLGDSNTKDGLATDGSAGYNAAIDVTHVRCLESRNADTVIANNTVALAQDPLQYSVLAPVADSIGPGLTFIRDGYRPSSLAAGRNVRLTAVAVGGTGFVNGAWCAPSTFTASISGTTMTVTGTPSSPVFPEMVFTGTGVTANTKVQSQLTGTMGAAGTYTVTISQTTASTTMTSVAGPLILEAVRRANNTIALNASNSLKLILWCSGANDASLSVPQAVYTSSFVAMAAYLRAQITGASAVPILIQPLVPAMVSGNGSYAAINAAHLNMPSNVSKCGWVDPSAVGLSGNIIGQTAVPYHLTAASQRLVGNPGFMNAWAAISP
jgi:hypothetical protein